MLHLTCVTSYLLLLVSLISLVHRHHAYHALILDRLLTFLMAFSNLVLKPPFLKVFLSIAIYMYPLLRLISYNLTTRCLAVTGGGSVSESGRLSQSSWPLGAL